MGPKLGAWSLVSGGAVPACLARPVARLLDILQDRVRGAARQLESCNQLTRASDGMGPDRQVLDVTMLLDEPLARPSETFPRLHLGNRA